MLWPNSIRLYTICINTQNVHSSLYEINFYDAILFFILSFDFYVVQRNGEKEEDKEKKYSQTAMEIICKHWIDRDFCALVSNNRWNLSVFFFETWTIAK